MNRLGSKAHGKWECPTKDCEVIEARYDSRSGVCVAIKLAARPRGDDLFPENAVERRAFIEVLRRVIWER